VGLELNGPRQLLVPIDVSLLGDNVDTMGNTDTLSDASKDVGLETNEEKRKVCVAVSSPECKAKS
jgi:hypothetical protein